MNDLEELYSKADFETPKEDFMKIYMDDIFRKKLRFLGIFQQVIGIFAIIYGAIICFGIISAIIGVPVIIIGLKVFKAGGAYKDAVTNANGENLKNGLCETSDAVKIYLIFLLVVFALSVIFMVFMFIMLMIAAVAQY